ncbi:MAG: pyridoxine 5'-phosphate synthase [Alphaproteobacteria bacterium]|nr:pyridoxine 5'-phosphate synthase [Alphaproteobacteria bacterium]
MRVAHAKLSVNINKYALLRNSRGHDQPSLTASASVCIAAGAHGITVHPRLDQRHVRFDDVPVLAAHLTAHHPGIELNIECQDDPDLLAMVREIRPHQCTLVPVTPGEVTSDHGYDPVADRDRLRAVIEPLKALGIRTSCFADAEPAQIPLFADTGTDRIELYTGPYAWAWGTPEQAAWVARLRACITAARDAGLGVNAGHDLDRHNLAGIADHDGLDEVSIGHAQICRALEVGTTQSVKELLAALGW